MKHLFKSSYFCHKNHIVGQNIVSTMDTLDLENGSARRENYKENNHDAEQNEGAGFEGEVIEIFTCKCPRHG